MTSSVTTRLEQHKQKEFYKKAGVMAGILLLVILFILFLGFQIIIKGSLFLGNLKGDSQKTIQDTTSEDFFGTISIDNIPSSTNSAQFVVNGSVTNFETLEFFINNQKVQTMPVNSDNYNVTIGDLQKGKNEVYVTAFSKDKKHQKKTQLNSIMFKNTLPKLDISDPSDHAKTSRQDLKVAGSTDKDVFIKINDLPVVVDAQGAFQQNVHLNDGDNKITVVAQDEAGNQVKKELTINYNKDN